MNGDDVNNEPGDEAFLSRDMAPEHGPTFWQDLEDRLAAEAGASDLTAELPAVEPAVVGSDTTNVTTLQPGAAQRRPLFQRRMLPLAAAAALLLLVGVGVVAVRDSGEPARTTEVVAGGEVADSAAPLDGPQDGTSDEQADDTDASDEGVESQVQVTPVQVTPVPVTQGPVTPVPVTPSAVTAVPAAPQTFDEAPGYSGDAADAYPPFDGELPDDATLLATWEDRALSWYAARDASRSCQDPAYSYITYVNASGITQPVRDPQLGFSGEISHFTVSGGQNLVAWLVSCGAQLELHISTLAPTGEMLDPDLIWFGEGSSSSALIIWGDDEVSLSSIDPTGKPFSVDYYLDTLLLSRNGGPSRIMLEAGAPGTRDLTPLAASPDAGLTYWSGRAPAGATSACPELYGSGVSDSLWLRQGEGMWQAAVATDTPLGLVTAAAIGPERGQFAFADWCEGQAGRVLIGSQLPDGRIGDLYELDLTPYVPGSVAQLFWVDETTLRIETDNADFGVDPVNYDFSFEGGREDGVMIRRN